LAGVTAMLVAVWATVTVTLLVTAVPFGSVIVTVNVYVPARVNVTEVFFAALVPFAENVGALAPLGTLVAAQVYVRAAAGKVPLDPETDRDVLVLVTVPDPALAAVATASVGCATSLICAALKAELYNRTSSIEPLK
jgi:hypothetical protein